MECFCRRSLGLVKWQNEHQTDLSAYVGYIEVPINNQWPCFLWPEEEDARITGR